MTFTQFLVMAASASLVTVPVVLLIPRARTSPAFDRLLWAATLAVSFLSAWVGVAMAKDAGTLNAVVVGQVGNRAGQLQHAVKGAGAQVQLLHRASIR